MPDLALANHAVIAGYGRLGKPAALALRAAGLDVVVIEYNHALFEDLSRAGFTGIWGDCTRPEILHAAQIATAMVRLALQ